MKCPGCGENLGRLSRAGEPMVRNKGLILKATGVAVVCPKCSGSVPIGGEMAKALSARLLLVFNRKVAMP